MTPGHLFPDLEDPLEDLLNATDWDEAIKQGRVVPRQVSSLSWSGRLASQAAAVCQHASRHDTAETHRWPTKCSEPMAECTAIVGLVAFRVLWPAPCVLGIVSLSHLVDVRPGRLSSLVCSTSTR